MNLFNDTLDRCATTPAGYLQSIQADQLCLFYQHAFSNGQPRIHESLVLVRGKSRLQLISDSLAPAEYSVKGYSTSGTQFEESDILSRASCGEPCNYLIQDRMTGARELGVSSFLSSAQNNYHMGFINIGKRRTTWGVSDGSRVVYSDKSSRTFNDILPPTNSGRQDIGGLTRSLESILTAPLWYDFSMLRNAPYLGKVG